jgi:hypothetical protein
MAGANRIFTGDKLLTAANAGDDKDAALLAKLGLVPMEAEEPLRARKALEAANEDAGCKMLVLSADRADRLMATQ